MRRKRDAKKKKQRIEGRERS